MFRERSFMKYRGIFMRQSLRSASHKMNINVSINLLVLRINVYVTKVPFLKQCHIIDLT